MQSLTDLLGADGILATHLDGFAPREAQQQMAEAVQQSLQSGGQLIAEAGTGTGKTFAYLLPALLSGQKVVVSTGTRNLQDQLFHKDLPLIRKTLGVSVDVALLKGRANYLCPYRLEIALLEGRFHSRTQIDQLQRVKEWSVKTRDGDFAELSGIPEDSPVWGRVTSSSENCLGGECDYIDKCHLSHARKRAQEVDLLVVNHHLLFADMALREEGFGDLLPGASAYILDEAHLLPEIASNFFGTTISSNQLLELARDATAEELQEADDSRVIRDSAEHLEKAVRDLRLLFGVEMRSGLWSEVCADGEFLKGCQEVDGWLIHLQDALKTQAERGKGLESCWQRCRELHSRFAILTESANEDFVHWFETHKRSFTINQTPLDIAPIFSEKVASRSASWIFTSATLAVADRFDHFQRRLGLDKAETRLWQSPFDFPRQAVLYVPPDLPEPSAPDYTAQVAEVALRLIEISAGRAFLLFTSHRALNQAAELLKGRIDYPMLVQGDDSRSRLLEQFREQGNAVLLGTGSFWEGVDVRGEALSLVVIDKLPFASPGDPVVQARIDSIRKAGGNPFFDYQLPQAVITLKQGAGRLIRDVSDNGALVLCDPRLGTRGYGRVFLDSLPAMTRTRKLEVVERFFNYVKQRTAQGGASGL